MAEEKNIENTNATPAENNPEVKEKEINLLEIFYRLWSQKKLILIWCMWGVLAGLIIAFSIPKEYTTKVTLAPEVVGTHSPISGGLSALASMAGISATANSGGDAVYPTLYPDVVESVPFLTSLFDVPLTDKKGETYTVKYYMTKKTRSPWWGYITRLPGQILGIFQSKEPTDSNHVLNNFNLTKAEDKLVSRLRGCITANVDQKTDVITIQTTMQDPVMSAMLADTVVARLREYITDYRTNKARKDLEYAYKLNEEAQQEYYSAQQRLADYIDRNQNLATRSAQVTQERLQNESTLAFNLYNETSLQVQNAKSRVQETTPVYTEIIPATVPIRASAPRKIFILIGFTFLAFMGCCAWILFAEPIKAEYQAKVEELKKGEKSNASHNGDDAP